MKTDGLFSAHSVIINAKLNEPFYIIPFGDIHRESEAFAHEEWEQFLAYAKKKKNTYFFGMGDFTDGCSTSERQILANAGMHDSTKATMKGVYRGVVKTLVNELSFMKGRIIGMLGGNHFYELENGENTDHVLAHSLGAKYLGCTALVRLNIILGNKKSTHLDIFANHGKGGGRTVGATFNAIEDMQKVADADIYVMGHTHSKGTMPSFPRMRLVQNGNDGVTVRARQPFLGRTGSFLKTYENGKKAYGVDALYPGCSLGVIEFEVTPIRVCKDGVDRIELKITGKA
jgi:hypothetical protein